MGEVLRRAVGQTEAPHSKLLSSRAVRTVGSAHPVCTSPTFRASSFHLELFVRFDLPHTPSRTTGTKLQAQRRHDEAEPLYRQALAGCCRLSRREVSEYCRVFESSAS